MAEGGGCRDEWRRSSASEVGADDGTAKQTNKTKNNNNVCFTLLLFDGSYLLLFTASPTNVTMHISLLLFFDVSCNCF